MTKTYQNHEQFRDDRNPMEFYGVKNSDGTVTDYETAAAYKAAHPEDFFSTDKLIPFDVSVFGTSNEHGEIVLSTGTEVQVIEAGENDVLVLCSDGDGNEWWERK